MLTLNSIEVKIVKAWAENAESSPFPQERAVISRLKKNAANRSMTFSARELDIILHWAEQETKGHYGTEQYLLELEALLLEKIENFLHS